MKVGRDKTCDLFGPGGRDGAGRRRLRKKKRRCQKYEKVSCKDESMSTTVT